MPDVQLDDNRVTVKNALQSAAVAFLHEAAGELVTQWQRRTRVDTGQTKGSEQYQVEEYKLEAYIGSPLENAIWEEFGTGEYALNNDGRKTPWRYKDRKGQWHTTHGKSGTRALFSAFNSTKSKIIAAAQEKLKGLK